MAMNAADVRKVLDGDDAALMATPIRRRTLLRSALVGGTGLVIGGLATACGGNTVGAPETTSSGAPSDASGAHSTEVSTEAAPSTGAEAMERLLDGNRRFVAGRALHPHQDGRRRAEVAGKQEPFAVVLTCSDSRVPPEILFDTGIGDLFVIRVAGNTAGAPDVAGSIEYAFAELERPVLMLVLGHQNCGAVRAAVESVRSGMHVPGQIPALIEPIVPAVLAVAGQPEETIVERAVQENVRRTVVQLRSLQPIVSPMAADGRITVAGAEYRLDTGVVTVVNV